MDATDSSQYQFDPPSPPVTKFSAAFDIVESRRGGDRDRPKVSQRVEAVVTSDDHLLSGRQDDSEKHEDSTAAANYKPPISRHPFSIFTVPPPSSVFGYRGENEKDLEEDIETRRRGLAAMWPDIAANKKKPELLSKTEAAFAAKVAVAAAYVAATDAADAAAKAADAAAKAADAAAYAEAAFAAATRSEELNPETKPPLDNPTTNHDDLDYDLPIELEPQFIEFPIKARKALEYYKDTKGEEFEFVEMVNFEAAFLYPYLVDHILFKATHKYGSDSSRKLFFAEIYERNNNGDYEVKMCMILDPSSQDVMKGCGYIQGNEDMLHPRGVQFWGGPPSGTPEWEEWEEERRKRSSLDAH